MLGSHRRLCDVLLVVVVVVRCMCCRLSLESTWLFWALASFFGFLGALRILALPVYAWFTHATGGFGAVMYTCRGGIASRKQEHARNLLVEAVHRI